MSPRCIKTIYFHPILKIFYFTWHPKFISDKRFKYYFKQYIVKYLLFQFIKLYLIIKTEIRS